MNLNVNKWKEFRFGDLINKPYKAKAFNKDDLEPAVNNGLRYITRTGVNNGCEMIINGTEIPQKYVEKGNAISIGDTTATCFYQDEDFITGDHMVIIRAKWLNRYNGLFIVGILQNERYKYSYGRAFLIDRIQETMIKLPIRQNSDGTPFIDNTHTYSEEGYVPDWQYMENYIKSLHYKPLTTKNKLSNIDLNIQAWKEFFLNKLFNVQLSTGDIKYDDMLPGNIPLISSGETNNGIVGYIDELGDGKAEVFSGNKITVDMFCNAFYQKDDFYSVSHGRVNILDPLFNMTDCVGLFIVSIINKEKYKYSYGRALYSGVLSNMIIKLPVRQNSDGTPFIDNTHTYSEEGYVPDWQYMENYIKTLPYGDRL